MGPGRTGQASRNAATIYEVASAAGVSIATVSRVLGGTTPVAQTTRMKVQDAIDELGYVPLASARGLAARSLAAYGLVLPELGGPYYSELVTGFEERASELGQSVSLLQVLGKRDVTAAVLDLAGRVDGLVVLACPTIPTALLSRLARTTPVIALAAHEPGDEVESVGTDNVESATRLAGHLLDHGITRLRFVGDPELGADIRGRYAGYLQAHAERGRTAPDPLRCDLRESAGFTVADELLAHLTLTARGARTDVGGIEGLMCANDELALAIMSRLLDAGVRVPEDVVLAGWDDVMAARYVRPGLTTVRQPVRELGALAAERLHDRVLGMPPGTGTVLPTETVLRRSCGCTERP